MKGQKGRSSLTTKAALQDQWKQLSDDEREKYETQLKEVNRIYNKQFNDEEAMKKNGVCFAVFLLLCRLSLSMNLAKSQTCKSWSAF